MPIFEVFKWPYLNGFHHFNWTVNAYMYSIKYVVLQKQNSQVWCNHDLYLIFEHLKHNGITYCWLWRNICVSYKTCVTFCSLATQICKEFKKRYLNVLLDFSNADLCRAPEAVQRWLLREIRSPLQDSGALCICDVVLRRYSYKSDFIHTTGGHMSRSVAVQIWLKICLKIHRGDF